MAPYGLHLICEMYGIQIEIKKNSADNFSINLQNSGMLVELCSVNGKT